MVLCINDQITAVTQQQADEVNLQTGGDTLLAEVDQHLFSRRCIEYVIIDPRILWRLCNDVMLSQIPDIVAQCLGIARQFIKLAVFRGVECENRSIVFNLSLNALESEHCINVSVINYRDSIGDTALAVGPVCSLSSAEEV